MSWLKTRGPWESPMTFKLEMLAIIYINVEETHFQKVKPRGYWLVTFYTSICLPRWEMLVSLLLGLNAEWKPAPLSIGNKKHWEWLAFDKTMTSLAKCFFLKWHLFIYLSSELWQSSSNHFLTCYNLQCLFGKWIFTCQVYNHNLCWIDNFWSGVLLWMAE